MVDILMATYNGEKYLEEQLNSIINQTYQDWRLIIADDCSQDTTVSILEKYHDMYPQKISFYINKKPSGAAQYNFFQLLDKAENRYIMFSDQDDVWLRDKIELTLDVMKKAEVENNMSTPILVHTDLCVVDEGLNILNKSIFAMQNMDFRRDRLNNLIVSNIVTGCSMMVNKPLLDLVSIKPRNSVMHDMWFGLVASAFGRIYFINQPTILYRQHGNNSNGAKEINSISYIISKLSNTRDISRILSSQYKQASEFLDIYSPKLKEDQIELLKNYSSLNDKSLLEKVYTLYKFKLFKPGLLRALGQIFFK